MNTDRVLYYFEEISKIPRASGNEGGIADYLVEQGRRLNLSVFRDAQNNVILKKQGKTGSAPVILQAHTDMVWETELTGDLPQIPFGIYVEDGKMKTRGTTLGADDGIGVALILALLERENGDYPDLEAVFTANEEETMEGAMTLKGESLKGRYLINLDSEEEGTLTVGAAGGLSVIGRLPLKKRTESKYGNTFKLTVKGGLGGHSGLEIHKDRENALLLLVRLLQSLQSQEDTEWELVSIEGGSRSNAIMEAAGAYINTDKPDKLRTLIDSFIKNCRYEWMEVEMGLQIQMEETACSSHAYDRATQEKILLFLENMPHGVYKRRDEIIFSSANLAIVKQTEEELTAEISLRSTYEVWLEDQAKKTGRFIKMMGGTSETLDGYAAWMGRSGARLTEVFLITYRKLFNREAICETVHAGVECGIILKNCPSVQEAISVGPTILHAHTVEEELDVDSVGKVYALLDLVLRSMG